MTPNYKRIGKNLRELRVAEGMTAQEVSVMAFPSAYSCIYEDPEGLILNVENGRYHSLDIIIMLSNFYWVSLDDIIDANGNIGSTGAVSGTRSLENVPINLVEVMKEEKMSCKRLADLSGISISTIQSYRTKRRRPSLKNLIILAEVLDISIDDLVEKNAT